MEKDLCVVCECRKCGHLRYTSICKEDYLETLDSIPKSDCDQCGEEGYDNWILRGVDDWNNRKIRY